MSQDWAQSLQNRQPVAQQSSGARAKKARPEQPLINRTTSRLEINEPGIRRIAREKNNGNLVLIVLHQVLAETLVCVRKNAQFRKRRNSEACQAYCKMSLHEFQGINARQSWANWRTIPRNLNRRLPNTPVKIVDLCCGIGQSTEVLAYYAAPGSEIIGYEFNPEFVALARKRAYLDEHGNACRVRFRAQSVLDTFCFRERHPLDDGSIDLVNSCGAVGCHFDREATGILAKEIWRVLKPGGLATIDSGPLGTTPKQLRLIFESQGFEILHSAKSCALDRYTQVCFRKL